MLGYPGGFFSSTTLSSCACREEISDQRVKSELWSMTLVTEVSIPSEVVDRGAATIYIVAATNLGGLLLLVVLITMALHTAVLLYGYPIILMRHNGWLLFPGSLVGVRIFDTVPAVRDVRDHIDIMASTQRGDIRCRDH